MLFFKISVPLETSCVELISPFINGNTTFLFIKSNVGNERDMVRKKAREKTIAFCGILGREIALLRNNRIIRIFTKGVTERIMKGKKAINVSPRNILSCGLSSGKRFISYLITGIVEFSIPKIKAVLAIKTSTAIKIFLYFVTILISLVNATHWQNK